jgi:hypothetical protein
MPQDGLQGMQTTLASLRRRHQSVNRQSIDFGKPSLARFLHFFSFLNFLAHWQLRTRHIFACRVWRRNRWKAVWPMREGTS